MRSGASAAFHEQDPVLHETRQLDVTRLLRAVRELAFARDLQTVAAIACAAARGLTGADGATFVVRELDACHYVEEDAIAPLWKGRRFPVDTCIAGWVMTHDQPAVIPDIHNDPRVVTDVYRPTFVKSLAVVPGRAPQPIAAIGAYWAQWHQASGQELNVLAVLAETAALAMLNVKDYQSLAASLERERTARVAAEAAIAAKDEFLALVAHELRQPLHSTLMAVRLMAHRPGPDAEDRARALVERQVMQMSRLVEDLVGAARVVRGPRELNSVPLDMRDVIHQVAESVFPIMAEREHEFVVSAPQQPLRVQGDASRLEQVFFNLLSNAAKYTPPGGRVTLSAERGENDVAITITDTGRGIDASTLPLIFNLFARGSTDVSGFGVGLAVSRRLVELHGGTIEVSSPGTDMGSQFTVRLPADSADS
jgi:signal transduction histidine kinase